MKNPLPRIDGYRIEGVLGRGATGVVYSAVQLAVDRPVAIKVLHPELVGKRAAVRRLQREARTAARLAHPGIISAIDMGEQDGLWWYAMELVEGISLGERLVERGPLTEREALRFFLPLVEALQHAHEGGVVHRDIKPTNILVDAHGKARLVDLGLAFAEDDPMVTKPGGTLGTPHYISPEQARDPSAADTRSDLWSLGATMYHAVCGRPPFEGGSVAEVLTAVLYQRVPDPRLFATGLSRGFSLVLRKCLTREPSRRYAEPAELLEDLERLVERRAPEVSVRSLDPVDDGRPPWLRKALVGGGLAAAAAALLLVTSPWTDGASEPEAPRVERIAWPALDQLRDRYDAGRLPLADATERLAQLSAPAGAEQRRVELANRLRLELDAALQGVVGAVSAEVEEALRTSDTPAARAVLDGVAERVVRETGYTGLEALPAGPARRRLERVLEVSARRVTQVARASRAEVSRQVQAYLRGTLIPAATAARDTYRWREAQELLATRADWLAAAGAGLPLLPEDQARVLEGAEQQLDPLRYTLYDHYTGTVEDLERQLADQDALLRQTLGGGGRDAARELRGRFEAMLVTLGLERGQVPRDYELRRPLEGRLETLAASLARDEAQVLERDAREDFRADRLQVADLLGARRAHEALAVWDARLAEPWRAPVHPEMQDRRREAELLEGLVQRAAEGLRAAHGEALEVTLDGITHPARVIATRPARELADAGVELDLPGLGPARVRLRRSGEAAGAEVLPASTLLEVAGLGDEGEDAFLRALFLFHEGDLAAARAVLPAGPIEDTVLLNDLRARLEEALEAEEERLARRVGEKGDLLRSLRRAVESGRSSHQLMLAKGRQLLVEYGDLLDRGERAEVEGICEDCERRLASPTLGERYPTAAVVERFNGAVSLTWTFEDAQRGAWSTGDWTHRDDQGLMRLEGERSSQEEFWAQDGALQLPLAPPLQVEETLHVTLRLRWADDYSEFDNDLVVTLAGMHLVFVDGPAVGEHRWSASRGDPQLALEELRSRPAPRFEGFEGYPRDRAFELRVELAAGRGRMKVWLDDQPLVMPRELLKAPVPDDPTLTLRTWYPMELLEVRLEGRAR